MNDLIEHLRLQAAYLADNAGRGLTHEDRDSMIVAFHEAADALEQRWIPCSERFPGEGETVLFVVCGEVWQGSLSGGEWAPLDGGGFDQTVTHWQPLPPPPESGG